MKIRPKVPAARLFSSAARHEANYYRPLLTAGQTIGHRMRTIAQDQPKPPLARPPEPLRISHSAGWYHLLTTVGVIGFVAAGVTLGDAWCLSLLPIATIPAVLAWGGLRRKKR